MDTAEMNDELIKEAMVYVEELFSNNSDGHDVDHTFRVYRNAMRIADKDECDKQIVALAALLHDADDHKLFQTENNYNARSFMESHNMNVEKIEAVCNIHNSVSFSKNRGKRPETIEGMIVQDADRLDAIGAIGIARCFAFGGSHGRDLDSSIAHFHEKLLLLKDEMNTACAKQIAEERHQFMEKFLEQYKKEIE